MPVNESQLQAVRDHFFQEGINIAEWAREKGFSPALVYSVLQGRLRARRGAAHLIAVELGLKHPQGKVEDGTKEAAM